jgi:hypothetical protein
MTIETGETGKCPTKSWLAMLSALLVVFVLAACQAGSARRPPIKSGCASQLHCTLLRNMLPASTTHDDHPGESPRTCSR